MSSPGTVKVWLTALKCRQCVIGTRQHPFICRDCFTTNPDTSDAPFNCRRCSVGTPAQPFNCRRCTQDNPDLDSCDRLPTPTITTAISTVTVTTITTSIPTCGCPYYDPYTACPNHDPFCPYHTRKNQTLLHVLHFCLKVYKLQDVTAEEIMIALKIHVGVEVVTVLTENVVTVPLT